MNFFLGDTDSFIPHLKIITVLHAPSCDLHGLPFLGGFDGIISQIDQNSLQQILLSIEFSLSQQMSTFTLPSSGFVVSS